MRFGLFAGRRRMECACCLVLAFFGFVLAGCRNDPAIALLERDNRLKEQEIYRLRNRVEDLEDALQSPAPAGGPGVPRAGRPGEPAAGPGAETARPRTVAPAATPSETPRPDTFVQPKLNIDMPGEALPPGETPDTLKVPAGKPSSRTAPSGSGGPSGASQPPRNSQVAQITLHPSLTGGINSSGRGADEGLLVVVEPRDFSGQVVEASGDMSIALLDPALSGEQARLARWDFTAAETAGMVRTGTQRGIHLVLPWKTVSPAHDRLKLFVRYTTADGRKLQAERLIGVALNSPQPAGRNPPTGEEPPQTASRPQWSPVR